MEVVQYVDVDSASHYTDEHDPDWLDIMLFVFIIAVVVFAIVMGIR